MGGFVRAATTLLLLVLIMGQARCTVNFTDVVWKGFEAYDSDYVLHYVTYGARLVELRSQLAKMVEQGGQPMPCSAQLAAEAQDLWEYAANWTAVDSILQRLSTSLTDRNQSWASQQSPQDGCWGGCYSHARENFYIRLDSFVNAIALLSSASPPQSPQYPVRCLGPIGLLDGLSEQESISRMINFLDAAYVSELSRVGISNRARMNAVVSCISQMVYKLGPYLQQHVRGFSLTPAYAKAFTTWVREHQNQQTGFWGQAYLTHENQLVFSPDISITYHLTAYGPVDMVNGALWSRLAQTLLDNWETQIYPYGMPSNYPIGHIGRTRANAHNYYDGVRLLHNAWGYIDDSIKQRAVKVLHASLDFVLKDSVSSAGVPSHVPAYAGVSDAYYFISSFFVKIGYFEKSQRFWTNQTFPDAHRLCCGMASSLQALHLKDQMASGALERLQDGCADCIHQ